MICLPESCQPFNVRNPHPILKVKKYTRRSQVLCPRTHTPRMSVRGRWGSNLPLYQSWGFSNHFTMLPSIRGKVRRQTLLDVTVSEYRNCKHVKNGEKERAGGERGGRGESLHLPLTLRDRYCSPGVTHHSSSCFSLTSRASPEVERLYPHFPDGKIETMEFK